MNYRFIDTHCHFGFPSFTGDEPASIRRVAEVGVQNVIVPATQAASFPRILALVGSYPPLSATLGLHPIAIEQHSDDCLDQLQQKLDKRPQKLVALDEIGLDLYRDDPQLNRQERVLETQLELAKRYELSMILHSRRTRDKLTMHLKRHTLPRAGVVHGFFGGAQQAERFMQLGYKIDVGGTTTCPRANKTRKVIAQLPLESLLLEADTPNMPLNSFQEQPNHPGQIVRVFNVLCELHLEPADMITGALYRNTAALFNT